VEEKVREGLPIPFGLRYGDMTTNPSDFVSPPNPPGFAPVAACVG